MQDARRAKLMEVPVSLVDVNKLASEVVAVRKKLTALEQVSARMAGDVGLLCRALDSERPLE